MRGGKLPRRQGEPLAAFSIVESRFGSEWQRSSLPAPTLRKNTRAALHKLPVGQKRSECKYHRMDYDPARPGDNGLLPRPNMSDSQVAILKGLLCVFPPSKDFRVP